MPTYLVRKTGKHIDVVHIPKNLSKKKQEVVNRNKRTVFKNYKEVHAKSQKAAVAQTVGHNIRKKKSY